MIQSCRCSYTDTVCANDEENVPMSIEEDDDLYPDPNLQDSLNPSMFSIEMSSLETHDKASELVMRVVGGSNVHLVTTEDILHNVVPHTCAVAGVNGIK